MTFQAFFETSNIHFILAIFVSVLNAVLLVLFAKKFLQILQISGYKLKGYRIWRKDTRAKYNSRLAMLASLSLACVLVINFLFDDVAPTKMISYAGLALYVYFSIVYIINASRAPQKNPLVQTRRMSRLMTLLFVLGLAISFALIMFSTIYLGFLRWGIVVATPVLVPLLVPVVHICTVPLEALLRKNYIRLAKNKLKKFPDLTIIGLTGSYGKTSVKYILNKLLGEKYSVCITPHSFNTPMGVTKVVLKYLKKHHNLLIVEMGATAVGDIKYLCDIVHPQHAIITGVGSQHYETFGSVQNIAKTKFELIESLPPNGIAVFNGTGESKRLFQKATLQNKCFVDIEGNGEVQAKNIKLGTAGTSFELCHNGKSQKCFTVLLGRHNVQNILLASAMAIKLGVALEDIAKNLQEVEPVRHRLEASTTGNITILDDAYSANEEGAKCALEVLALFDECVKICVTPGIVELGVREKEVNVEFGKQIAATADFVVIVNKINEEALKAGLTAAGFAPEKIISAENLELAKVALKDLTKLGEKRVAVLFCNDLPDNYT